jgi:hypothetical protein
MGARERSVATALLLVLVFGTGHARALASRWQALPPRNEVAVAEAALHRVARRPVTHAAAATVAPRPFVPVHRFRSRAARELPPLRAPDCA